MVKGISVVIPNYNGLALFPLTLPTVIPAMENCNRPFEIIIADDCSTDASVEYLKQNYPQIKIVQNLINSGFSVTANNGIAAAMHDKVLLLNSDVKLTPDYFEPQYKYFDEPGTFGVMGRIIGWEDDIIQDGAKYPLMKGAKIKTARNYLLKDEKAMEEGLYSMYLSGANAFMDKNKFLEIQGFNDLFSPFSSEDYELSLRAWRLGFKCYYEHNSICRHHRTSATIHKVKKKKYIDTVYNRNKMFLHAIHLSGGLKFLWYLQLIPETFIRLITLQWDYVRSLSLFFSSAKKIKEARKSFKTLASGLGCNKTVKEVIRFILDDIGNKEKIIF